MKGIVFTEFLEHAENRLGPLDLERMIDGCDLESGGAYTSVGTYPCSEMVKLVSAFGAVTGESPTCVLHAFGRQLAESFYKAYPDYYEVPTFFDFVESVDNHVHAEVLKLYPDAELPRFQTVSRDVSTLVVDYTSSRNLEELARGLLEATANQFGETVKIDMAVLPGNVPRTVRFTLVRS